MNVKLSHTKSHLLNGTTPLTFLAKPYSLWTSAPFGSQITKYKKAIVNSKYVLVKKYFLKL